jgi:hypothetical protein
MLQNAISSHRINGHGKSSDANLLKNKYEMVYQKWKRQGFPPPQKEVACDAVIGGERPH